MTMKVALVGLAQAGKTTVFRSLCGGVAPEVSARAIHVANVKVPDERIEGMAEMFHPQKKVYADIDFMDMARGRDEEKGAGLNQQAVVEIRPVDTLMVVVRAFENPSVVHPLDSINPVRDAKNVEAELILNDLMQVEKRLQRMEKEPAKPLEKDVLLRAKALLDQEKPLRLLQLTAAERGIIGGYSFLSQKPSLLLLNISETDTGKTSYAEIEEFVRTNGYSLVRYCAEIEAEIAELKPEEQLDFLAEMGLDESGRERLIREVYHLLNLISFLTTGEDEVRAWSIPKGTNALTAAGKIHSDIERGFIRAEVIHYEKLMKLGSMHAAKESGNLRLEGKEYEVRDGDVISFRFHV